MRIVLTSGYAAGSVETLDFPATFLPKPYTIDELEKTLDNLDSPVGRHPLSEAPSLA
ncbi:MAG: hypothetical protein H7315_00980 [Herminiimonas sp.]|nr:hypothetical protein [Herminiimonas sp.]